MSAEKREADRRKTERRDSHTLREPRTERETWAKKGLVALAKSDADRASIKNEAGFDKDDSTLGNHLANRIKKGLTDFEWTIAILICKRHQIQCGKIPLPEARR